jgi:hypothetical protein
VGSVVKNCFKNPRKSVVVPKSLQLEGATPYFLWFLLNKRYYPYTFKFSTIFFLQFPAAQLQFKTIGALKKEGKNEGVAFQKKIVNRPSSISRSPEI